MSNPSIETIEIPVASLARAVAWYSAAFGYTQEWADDHHALLSAGLGPRILLVQTDDPARLGFVCSHTGLAHGVVDFQADDLDALHTRLAALGHAVDPLDEPAHDWAPRGFGFADPDGNRLGAFQRYR